MFIFDGHTHIGNDTSYEEILLKGDMCVLASASNPEECEQVLNLSRRGGSVIGCFGIHPLYAGQVTLKEMEPYLDRAHIIGEIGLDNVFSDVPLKKQRGIFSLQLALAERRGRPVILHTKGCEEEVSDRIKDLGVPVLVHWYSCMDYLQRYIDMDCYFTIGPDVKHNPAVRQAAEAIPLNRMLIGSGGLQGLALTMGRVPDAEDIASILIDNIRYVARLRKVDSEALQYQMVRNAIHFSRWKRQLVRVK